MQKSTSILSINSDAFEAFLKLHITNVVREVVKDVLLEIENQKSIAHSNDEWITRKQAMEILRVSAPTIVNWGKSGIIPCYRMGSRIRYKRSEIDKAFNQAKLKYRRFK